MPFFKKKPVVIQAVQWTGDNLREVVTLVGLHEPVQSWDWDDYEKLVANEGLKIFTLEGTMNASIADYIILGIQGEAYPCKPDVFAASYEKIDSKYENNKDGFYSKYYVDRVDGGSAPGCKHEHCSYFVLDLHCDTNVGPALQAYAESCREKSPDLAAQLLAVAGMKPASEKKKR